METLLTKKAEWVAKNKQQLEIFEADTKLIENGVLPAEYDPKFMTSETMMGMGGITTRRAY